jgi:AcrR family transcriptional regulator
MQDMPKQLIDETSIIEAAYELAKQAGLRAVTARAVADACSVSAGTIYNYFPSMDDLHVAVVARFFTTAFCHDSCLPSEGEGYLHFCRRLFETMQVALKHFREDWLLQVSSLTASARTTGKAYETKYLDHIQHALEHVLVNDPCADTAGFVSEFGASAIAAFTLDSMMGALRKHDNCSVLFVLLERSLYAYGHQEA